MSRLSKLCVIVWLIVLSNAIFAADAISKEELPLLPGTTIIPGDSAKNEFFIVAQNNTTIPMPQLNADKKPQDSAMPKEVLSLPTLDQKPTVEKPLKVTKPMELPVRMAGSSQDAQASKKTSMKQAPTKAHAKTTKTPHHVQPTKQHHKVQRTLPKKQVALALNKPKGNNANHREIKSMRDIAMQRIDRALHWPVKKPAARQDKKPTNAIAMRRVDMALNHAIKQSLEKQRHQPVNKLALKHIDNALNQAMNEAFMKHHQAIMKSMTIKPVMVNKQKHKQLAVDQRSQGLTHDTHTKPLHASIKTALTKPAPKPIKDGHEKALKVALHSQ